MKPKHQIFVDEIIKGTNEIEAYQKAYPKASEETARVNCYRLLQNATIASAIKESADKIRVIATQEAITELKGEIKGNVLTTAEKRDLLYKIAYGKIEIEKEIITKDGPVVISCLPDHSDRMKAIDMDNKMAGDYAPEKRDLTTKGESLNKHIVEIHDFSNGDSN